MKLAFKPVIFSLRNVGPGFGIRLNLHKTVVFCGLKRPGLEAGHSHQLGVEVKTVSSVVIMTGILIKVCLQQGEIGAAE